MVQTAPRRKEQQQQKLKGKKLMAKTKGKEEGKDERPTHTKKKKKKDRWGRDIPHFRIRDSAEKSLSLLEASQTVKHG